MTLQEVNTAAACITDLASPDANVIFGSHIDDTMGSVLSVTVVATGFDFQ
jgi:cell division protein FtsZ